VLSRRLPLPNKVDPVDGDFSCLQWAACDQLGRLQLFALARVLYWHAQGNSSVACVMEGFLLNRRRSAFRSRAFILCIAAGTIIPTAASAQGLFDFLFRGPHRPGPSPSVSAYADPSAEPSQGRRSEPQRSRRRSEPERRAAPSAPNSGFCVRMCDGRYFPVQRTSGLSTPQLCNSVCPAAETKVFSGSGIDHAVASDGSRYTSLSTAFAYRERVVENCTCNGRDPYGLVTLSVTDDPTLRHGDIIATSDGFVAYTGGSRRQAEFTPIESYRGLSAEARDRLSETKITPNATPVSPDMLRGASATVQDDRQAQLR
jgi:hypothetical protein